MPTIDLPDSGQSPNWAGQLNGAIETINDAVDALPSDIADPGTLVGAALSNTYVTFRNHDGTPVTGKHVIVTLTADRTDIEDIKVEAL